MDMNYESPALVAQTWMDSEAFVIKSLLEGYNIPCHFLSRMPHMLYPINVEGLAEFRIYVPAPLADTARIILEEHRRTYDHLRLVDSDT